MLFTLMFGLHLFFLLIAINTVIFVDQFIKYIWFYALQNKSKAYFVFVTFKSLVENYFSFTINSLFADNGGEYVALCSFLSTNGNSHLTTPYTPEHNGYSERRHRHIVETVLALFHRASFWKNFGPMHLPQLCISLMGCPRRIYPFYPSSKSSSTNRCCPPNFESLVVFVFRGYVLTVLTNYLLGLTRVSFFIILSLRMLFYALIFLIIGFLFLDMFSLLKMSSHIHLTNPRPAPTRTHY